MILLLLFCQSLSNKFSRQTELNIFLELNKGERMSLSFKTGVNSLTRRLKTIISLYPWAFSLHF